MYLKFAFQTRQQCLPSPHCEIPSQFWETTLIRFTQEKQLTLSYALE